MTVSRVERVGRFESSESVFVGRKRELSILGAALQQAGAGSGSIFLLSGEAGTGKSLLVSEFSAFARTAGAKVLHGRASVRFRNVPFGVWKQILSAHPTPFEDPGSDFLSIEAPSALVASVPLPQPAEPQSQPEWFETTARALAEHARTQPLVLVFDDLHVADPLSLQAFGILAHQLARFRALVIGVYRDSEINRFQEFRDLLLDPLMRDSKRISLAAFDDEETREFARSRGASPQEETLATLRDLTGGNPRLLDIALRRGLISETALESEKWLGGLARAEIEGHLENLSKPAREVLSSASLAGPEFGLSSLFHVLQPHPGALLDSLHEAEQSGLLLRTEIPGTYRFRHLLVREILAAELSGTDRARLHQRFGEVLEALHPGDETYLEEVADHFYEAALVGGAGKAADYCSRAAARAFDEARPEAGSRFYHMAKVALELQGSIPSAIRDLKAKSDAVSCGRTQSPSPELQLEGSDRSAERAIVASCAGGAEPAKLSSKLFSIAPARVLQTFVAPPRAEAAGEIEESGGEAERAKDQAGAPGAGALANQSVPDIQENTLRKEGDFWTLVFENKILRLKDCNGLLFVAYLLRHPDRDFHVAQLVALLPSARANQAEAAYISHSDKERLGMHTISKGNSDPLLDPTAKADYRRRIEELREALEDAKSFNDPARVEELEKELEFIGLELSRAIGVGGRDRKHRTENERARVNVTNAIRSLTAKIAEQHPALSRYLRTTIQTGQYCSYRPDPNSAPRWRF